MRFEWQYEGPPLKLAAFLKQQGFSRAQLKKLRYQGGFVFVNKRQRHTAYPVRSGTEFWYRQHLSTRQTVWCLIRMIWPSVTRMTII